MTQSATQLLPDTRNVKGAALITGAVGLMALQDALIKLMSTDLPLGQIFLLRSALVLPLMSLLAWKGAGADWRAALGAAPLLRGLCLTLMYLALYSVLQVLPLATLAAGFYTGPIFITLLAALFLKEPVGIRGWLGVATGSMGVLVLLRPGSDSFTPAALIPILSGFCYAAAAVLTRGTCRDDSPMSLAIALNVTLLLSGILMTGAGTFLAGGSEDWLLPLLPWADMGMAAWQLILLLVIMMLGIGIGLAAAYQCAAPAVVASFDYSYLIFATLLGYLFFAEVPDVMTMAGMGLIAGAGFISIAKPRRRRKD